MESLFLCFQHFLYTLVNLYLLMLTLASLLYFKYLPFLSEQGEEKWVLNSHPAASHWHDLLLPTCSGCACRPQEKGEWKRVYFLSTPLQWEDQNSLDQNRSSAWVNSQLCWSAQVLRYNDCSFHTSHNLIRNFPLQFWEELIMALSSITLSSKHSPYLNL